MATPRGLGMKSLPCCRRLCRPPIWDFLLPLVCDLVLLGAELNIYSACCQDCASSCSHIVQSIADTSCLPGCQKLCRLHMLGSLALGPQACSRIARLFSLNHHFPTHLDCSQYFDLPTAAWQRHMEALFLCAPPKQCPSKHDVHVGLHAAHDLAMTPYIC